MVAAITCTRGRHSLLERCVGLFLKQDYEGLAYQIIFNNSPTKQELAPNLNTENKKIILINNNIDTLTGKPYSTINRIFEDAMGHVPNEVELVTFFDDDDVFLKNHISEGVKGYNKAKEQEQLAYQPYYSLCQTSEGITKMNNWFEPSIFVNKDWVNKYGFSTHSAAYHHQWLIPLMDNNLIFQPLDGPSTFVYQWVGGCYHISGDGNNPENLKNHNTMSTDEGDRIITPS